MLGGRLVLSKISELLAKLITFCNNFVFEWWNVMFCKVVVLLPENLIVVDLIIREIINQI